MQSRTSAAKAVSSDASAALPRRPSASRTTERHSAPGTRDHAIAQRTSSTERGRRASPAAKTPSYSQPRQRNANNAQTAGAQGRGGRVKQYIDPSKFVCEAKQVVRDDYIPQHRFQDFKVHPRIIENLLARGYETPTPIQDQTIVQVLSGRDVTGIANTGTGKTAAFSIPLIHDLVTHMDNRLLVMAPTRELAQQIVEEMLIFSKGCGLKIALLIGGASMNIQTRDLRARPRIVVGTPGRIKDHISQKTLDLSGFNRLVLDEVDRMLDMGFIRDITAILSKLNLDRQSLFFSATLEGDTKNLISRFSKDPVTVSVRVGSTAENVSQDVVWYKDKDDKIERLHDILIGNGCVKTIIFDDTKRLVERLAKELDARGFRVDRIHGDKSQAQRTRAIKRLKADEIDILVATDVAARGIDVSDISHVINYSQPNTYEDYVHRIGRTGRAGKTGCALTFLPK